ncbi:hypothetical protein ACFQ2B_01225 [Streptomyces stramineus]
MGADRSGGCAAGPRTCCGQRGGEANRSPSVHHAQKRQEVHARAPARPALRDGRRRRDPDGPGPRRRQGRFPVPLPVVPGQARSRPDQARGIGRVPRRRHRHLVRQTPAHTTKPSGDPASAPGSQKWSYDPATKLIKNEANGWYLGSGGDSSAAKAPAYTTKYTGEAAAAPRS